MYVIDKSRYIFPFAGDAVDIHSDQSPRVLPAGCGNYTTHIIGCASFGEVPDIRYDPRFNKVRYKVKHTVDH